MTVQANGGHGGGGKGKGRNAASFPRPRELDDIDVDRPLVIEASAGTGKTYLLEHLVLHLIIEGRATIDEILIVTFTEKATAELKERIARKIDEALAAAAACESGTPADEVESAVAGGGVWVIDSGARDRLHAARAGLDGAAISTIHAFCQRILTEEGFAMRRLLGQSRVDGRALFADALREVLRRRLSVDEALRPYLDAYLDCGRSLEQLEDLLFSAHRLLASGARWARPFDPEELARVVQSFAALDTEAPAFQHALKQAYKQACPNRRVTAVLDRVHEAQTFARAALAQGHPAGFLAALEPRTVRDRDYFVHVENGERAAAVDPSRLGAFGAALTGLLDAAPPLDEVVAQLFTPLVADEVRRRKLAEGFFDFDDMVTAVAEALEAPETGDELAEKLRRRYRYALVDECQDTDPAQWRIFRRVFLAGEAPHRLTLIGDPKQAIYGFRGADVATFLAAREEMRALGGQLLPLTRNFRSTPEVTRAYNAILEQDAEPPFFSSAGIRYDHPVSAERIVQPGAGDTAVTLLAVELRQGDQAERIGVVKQAVGRGIAAEIARLAAAEGTDTLADIFVLTRSTAEAVEMGGFLRALGIPSAFYKQDGLFRTAEAGHVATLLAALAEPEDRAARMQVWLTPFFGAQLAALAAAPEPGAAHPLCTRLESWRALADGRAYEQLFARILDDSGVARRLRFAPNGARRLTNYRHLFDVLLAEGARRRPPIAELRAWLDAVAGGHRTAPGEEGDVQRIETDRAAVQIMTLHKSKGLEADTVFLYGGLTHFGRRPSVEVMRRPEQGDTRLLRAGRPRRPADGAERKALAAEEDQRLLYVGLTRARRRLYLPFFPATEGNDSEGREEDNSALEPFKYLYGCYRHLNRRLRSLWSDPRRPELFDVAHIPCPAPLPALSPDARAAIAAWTPSADLVARAAAPDADTSALEELKATRRGFAVTSYTRLKQAQGGYRSPEVEPRTAAVPFAAQESADEVAETLGEIADVGDVDLALALDRDGGVGEGVGAGMVGAGSAGEDTGAGTRSAFVTGSARDGLAALPGGSATGLFLHAVLEKVPLSEDLGELDRWGARADVRTVLTRELARWEQDPRHLDAVLHAVHAALTAPLPVATGALPGVARAERIRREVEFMFPVTELPRLRVSSPEDRVSAHRDVAGDAAGFGDVAVASRNERPAGGFVRGVLDVLFEHRGQVFFADWKSDRLPSYAGEALQSHVAENYDIQIQLYTLAVLRMLGISLSEPNASAEYERRFGGLAYVFLRGLPGSGVVFARPAFSDVQAWSAALGGKGARP